MDAQGSERLCASLRKRINGTVAEMRAVFTSFDPQLTGVLPAKTFEAACAALGVVLSAKEQAWVQHAAVVANGSGDVDWQVFCSAFQD